jgi:phosphoribosylformylglycinamidine synthase
VLGATGGDALTLPGGNAISLSKLRLSHEAWLPGYMS